MKSYTLTELATVLAEDAATAPGITPAHLFPLEGISASAEWLADQTRR